MAITILILIITITLFIWGRLRADFVALLSLLALYITGILTTEQALAGFSDKTVVLIAALFVVGEGLSRTGLGAWAGEKLLKLGGDSEIRTMIVLLVGTGLIGAFISNTGTVALMLPIVVAASWRIGSRPSFFLIPLAFVANIGGLLTLVSTPRNVIVADLLAAEGIRPFGFFEFSLIGIPLLTLTILFMVFIGKRLLPERKPGEQPIDLAKMTDELAHEYALPSRLFRLRVRYDSSLAGKTLAESKMGEDFGVSVLRVQRQPRGDGNRRSAIRAGIQAIHTSPDMPMPSASTRIEADDLLLVKGTPDAVEQAARTYNLGTQPLSEIEDELQDVLFTREIGMAEIVIPPRSRYIGRTISEGRFSSKYNVQVLNILRRGEVIARRTTKLAAGDVLLVRATWEELELLRSESQNFVVIGSPAAVSREVVQLGPTAAVAIFAILAMVLMMVTGVVSTVMAAMITAAIMILGGCLSPADATNAIEWNMVLLLAALLPMSAALQITGASELAANGLIALFGGMHPIVLMAGVFLLTTGFTQVITNTAATVLVAPIVLAVVLEMGLSPHPFLMTVAVAAATGFLTPIATSTNLMVMTPGGYRFGDYMKIGLPLLLIIFAASLALIPLIWPF